MRAMHYRSSGGSGQIVAAEVPTPRPAATQVLVKVAASSVNPVDWKLRHTQGLLYRPVAFPSIPGADISGEVVEAGGVGHFAVQIARSYGAHVAAVCSGKHADMVRGLGADTIIDYTRREDLAGAQPYDLVFDLIVRTPLRDIFALMAPAGVLVSTLPTFSRVSAAVLLPFISRRRVHITAVKARAADLEQLRALCEAGRLRPVIDRTYALAELAAAHACSQQGHAAGKILVTMAG